MAGRATAPRAPSVKTGPATAVSLPPATRSPTSPGTNWTTNRRRLRRTCGCCSLNPVSRLDPEGRPQRVRRLEESRRLGLHLPGRRQRAARRSEESGEEDRGAAAGDARARRDVEQVLAPDEEEGADVGAGVDGESARAEAPEFAVAAATAAGAADREAGQAAAGERGFAAAFGNRAPRFRQVPVPVLEEAGEELRGRLAAEAGVGRHFVAAGGKADRADPVVVQDFEAGAGRRRGWAGAAERQQ